MWRLILSILIASVAALNIMRATGIDRWVISVGLLGVGVALYVVNMALIHKYISDRAPEFAKDDDWQLTAGLGVVPHWVSWIGIIAVALIVTAVVGWIVSLVRWAS
jgi:hypothetical protein